MTALCQTGFRVGRRPQAIRPRPRSGRRGLKPGGGAGELGRADPARRAARLPPPLGRRAPQHAGDRELEPAGPDRAPRRAHEDDPGGLGRRDAAQPRAARGRRAVRRAGGAAPRPHRPGHRPRAGHRPRDRRRAAPHGRPALGRGLPPAARRADRVVPRGVPRGSSVRGHHGRAGRGVRARALAARFLRLLRAGRRDARLAVRVRAPLLAAQHAARARALPVALHPLRAA